MFLQSYLFDEIELCGEHLVGFVSAQHFHEQCDDALHDEGVAVGVQLHQSVAVQFGVQPYAALAAVYEVVVGLLALVEGGEFAAEVYQQLVFVHPVVKVLEFFYHFVLQFVYCHVGFMCLSVRV